jgi:hypothetical protein
MKERHQIMTRFLPSILVLLTAAVVATAQVSLVGFQPDTPILSSDVNQNFQNLANMLGSLEDSVTSLGTSVANLEATVASLDVRTLQLEATAAELTLPRVARLEIPAGRLPPVLQANDLLIDMLRNSIEIPKGAPFDVASDVTLLEQGVYRIDGHFRKIRTSSGVPDVFRMILLRRGQTVASSAGIFVGPGTETPVNGSGSFLVNIGPNEVGVSFTLGLRHGGGVSTFIDVLGDATFVITYLGEEEN